MNINEDNLILYAARHYENHHSNNTSDFYSDLKRVKYIKTLFKRYFENDDLQERLILNHIIIFCNVFGVECGVNLLFFKIHNRYYPTLKSFLLFLNYITDDTKIEIPLDPIVVNKLREI
jgi:hypothetical protein